MMNCAEKQEFEKALERRDLIERLDKLQRQAARQLFDVSGIEKLILQIKPYRSEEYSAFYIENGTILHRKDHAGKECFLSKDISVNALLEIYADRKFLIGSSTSQ